MKITAAALAVALALTGPAPAATIGIDAAGSYLGVVSDAYVGGKFVAIDAVAPVVPAVDPWVVAGIVVGLVIICLIVCGDDDDGEAVVTPDGGPPAIPLPPALPLLLGALGLLATIHRRKNK